VSQLTYLVSQ